MRKYLFPAALLLGFAFDLLFWGKTPGISFPVFVLLSLSAGILLLRKETPLPSRNTALLLVPILFFSFMVSFRKEFLTASLDLFLALFLMAVFAMTYLSGQWVSFNLWDYAANFFHLVGGMFALPWISRTGNDDREKESSVKTWLKTASPIIRGVLLAIPILLVFSALFSSADLVFANRLELLFANLKLEKLPEYLFRGFLILTTAYLFTGVILYAAQRSKTIRLTGIDKPVIPPLLGSIETNIILGGVLLLFSSFVLIQFKYFFFGQANITFEGFTYAEYARRGFGELVAVAVFSILLIKSLSVISKRDSIAKIRVFSWLTIGLVGLVLVILISAYQRLFLYESAYGFTRSRTYAHIFILWLGIFLVGIALMEVFKRQRAFATMTLFIAAGFAISLNLLNVDRFIVNRNIDRAVQGYELDVNYLSSLSNDAIPPLVNHFTAGKLPPMIHEGTGAALKCFQQSREISIKSKKHWQSFHFSTWRADRSLQKIQQELQTYQLNNDEWPVTVTSPKGTDFTCQDIAVFD